MDQGAQVKTLIKERQKCIQNHSSGSVEILFFRHIID